LKAEQLSIVVCGEVHLQTYLLGLFDQDLPFSIKFYEEP